MRLLGSTGTLDDFEVVFAWYIYSVGLQLLVYGFAVVCVCVFVMRPSATVL
jgi:hypothetical protein